MKVPAFIALLFPAVACAQLTVSVAPPRVIGQTAAVALALKNDLNEHVQSARAAVFLMDERGQVVGQGTRWIIGGTNTNGFSVGATNIFHFVVAGDKPFTTTNLTAKVVVNRLVLEGGKLADVNQSVVVTPAEK